MGKKSSVTTAPSAEAVKSEALMPFWLALLGGAVSGLLMDFATPDLAIWPLAFVSVALLLLCLIGRSIPHALLVGLAYGVFYYSPLVSWTSRYLGPVPWIALTAAEAVITAVLVVLITFAYRYLPRALTSPKLQIVVLPLVIASVWIIRELVLGNWPYGGFPWARLAVTQSESAFASVASWLGISGLGFLMVALVALGIEIVRLGYLRRPLVAAIPVLVLVAMAVVPSFSTTVVGTMKIGAVQGNGPAGYFDKRPPYAVLQAQSDAGAELIGQELDLVVWPEGSVDYDPFRSQETARRLSEDSAKMGAPLLVNVAVTIEDETFNTSLLWGTDDGLQTHAKRHPVPFGEYIPDRAFFRLFAPDLVDLVKREYSPGTDAPLMTVGDATIGLAICFDVIYDEVIREGLYGGAEVLVFQTNNADFRGTDENLQQLAFARMRAIESGRWVVNVSTVGTSEIITPNGVSVSSLPADQAGVLVAEVERRTGITAGVVLGPAIELLVVVIGFGAIALAMFIGRSRKLSADHS